MVDVDEQDAQRLLPAPGLAQACRELLVEMPPVVQPGEAVDPRQPVELDVQAGEALSTVEVAEEEEHGNREPHRQQRE
jgi:hypothetical protein